MAYTPAAQKDIEAWQRWKRHPGPETVGPLLDRIDPILNNALSGSLRGITGGRARVPQVAVKGMAVNEALYQLWNNYDPSGSQINTYLTNYIYRKMGSQVNVYQNLVRIPHGKSEKVKPVLRAERDLQEEQGKDYVSDADIADRIKIPVHHVEAIRNQAGQSDYLASKAEMESADEESPFQRALSQTYVELPQQDRAVFDLWIKQNKPAKDVRNLLGMSRRQLSDVQKRIREHVQSNHAYMG